MPLYLAEREVAVTLSMTDALRLLDAAARKITYGSAISAPRERVNAGTAVR